MQINPANHSIPNPASKLTEALKNPSVRLHPLFSPQLEKTNTVFLDFSSGNKALAALDLSDTGQLAHFVFGQIEAAGASYGFGGYMEDRAIYRRSAHFAPSDGPARSIHLGVDIWVTAGTPVHLPIEGRVHSFQVNDTYGDYGPTIIVEHRVQEQTFYTLYGHLGPDSLQGLVQGKPIRAGEAFCRVGNFPGNGDWPPHLHFQLITDMRGKTGDFPGVCLPDEVNVYQVLCPDPAVFFPELSR